MIVNISTRTLKEQLLSVWKLQKVMTVIFSSRIFDEFRIGSIYNSEKCEHD